MMFFPDIYYPEQFIFNTKSYEEPIIKPKKTTKTNIPKSIQSIQSIQPVSDSVIKIPDDLIGVTHTISEKEFAKVEIFQKINNLGNLLEYLEQLIRNIITKFKLDLSKSYNQKIPHLTPYHYHYGTRFKYLYREMDRAGMFDSEEETSKENQLREVVEKLMECHWIYYNALRDISTHFHLMQNFMKDIESPNCDNYKKGEYLFHVQKNLDSLKDPEVYLQSKKYLIETLEKMSNIINEETFTKNAINYLCHTIWGKEYFQQINLVPEDLNSLINETTCLSKKLKVSDLSHQLLFDANKIIEMELLCHPTRSISGRGSNSV